MNFDKRVEDFLGRVIYNLLISNYSGLGCRVSTNEFYDVMISLYKTILL